MSKNNIINIKSIIIAPIISLIITSCIFSKGFISFAAAVVAVVLFFVFVILSFVIVRLILKAIG